MRLYNGMPFSFNELRSVLVHWKDVEQNFLILSIMIYWSYSNLGSIAEHTAKNHSRVPPWPCSLYSALYAGKDQSPILFTALDLGIKNRS